VGILGARGTTSLSAITDQLRIGYSSLLIQFGGFFSEKWRMWAAQWAMRIIAAVAVMGDVGRPGALWEAITDVMRVM